MQRRITLAAHLGEQRQRDHALAAARSAGNDDDPLVVTVVGALDSPQHQLVSDALLVDQIEVGTVREFVGRVREQVPAGAYRAGEETVSDVGPAAGREARLEIRTERAAALLGEDPAVLGDRAFEQLGDVAVHGIVQVGDAVDRVFRVRQHPEEVAEVTAVLRDLETRVQARTAGGALDAHQCIGMVQHHRP
jgi:hypothetical protein